MITRDFFMITHDYFMITRDDFFMITRDDLIPGVARVGHCQLRGGLALRRLGRRPLRGACDRWFLQVDRPRPRALAAGMNDLLIV